jgi:undecaprenyl diphosphate synthase
MGEMDAESGAEHPRYVAMIADGNRRWASAQGRLPSAGHEAGADTLRARIADAIRLGVRELTVFSFSTENWARPPEEVAELIEMLTRRIACETPGLHERGVRMRFAEELTVDNRRLDLYVAFNYGGRAEIVEAAARFEGGTEQDFRACLYVPEMHDPDLVIRTGAEQRLSNYLLWQAAYAELVFRDELWPEFSREAFEDCIEVFQARKRRFGGR